MSEKNNSLNEMLEHKMEQAVTEGQIFALKELVLLDSKLTIASLTPKGVQLVNKTVQYLQEKLDRMENEREN